MKGYWIGHLTVTDPEKHLASYVPASTAAIAKFGGRFLVRGGTSMQTEGHARPRHIVIEFPSYEAAVACYDSPDYRAAHARRADTAEADISIAQGIEL